MRTIVMHLARIDAYESAQWYEDQGLGLGADFLEAMLATFDEIEEAPHRFPVVYRDARRAQLKRFPYAAFFVMREGTAYIFAVAHLHQDTRLWQKRTPKTRRKAP